MSVYVFVGVHVAQTVRIRPSDNFIMVQFALFGFCLSTTRGYWPGFVRGFQWNVVKWSDEFMRNHAIDLLRIFIQNKFEPLFEEVYVIPTRAQWSRLRHLIRTSSNVMMPEQTIRVNRSFGWLKPLPWIVGLELE